LLLQSTLRLDLGNAVEEALQKGMPLYFVTEAELVRDRWYWYDKKMNTHCPPLPTGLPASYPHVAFECVARANWDGGFG
jgi:hypothetical protein